MVPTLTWGLVRVNFSFPIFQTPKSNALQPIQIQPIRQIKYPQRMQINLVPFAGIGPATSPLPRECSTTEPQGQNIDRQSIHRKPQVERETGIEPASLAWKARVLPLNYSRIRSEKIVTVAGLPALLLVGFRWWRGLDSNQCRRKPTDLQSAPFSHSGTPPANREL